MLCSATTPMTEMSQEMRDFLGLMHIPQAGESGMIAALSNGATMEDMAISRDFKITSTTEETTNEFGKTFVTTMEKQCNMTMDAARPTVSNMHRASQCVLTIAACSILHRISRVRTFIFGTTGETLIMLLQHSSCCMHLK